MFEEPNEYYSRLKNKNFVIKNRTNLITQSEIECLVDDLTLNSVGYEINNKENGYLLKTSNCALDITQSIKNKSLRLNIKFSSFGLAKDVQTLNKKNVETVNNYFQV